MTLTSSTVAKGSYAEYSVSKRLESLGFSHIIRSYASHGPIDLLCANVSGEVWAVQVKSSKHGSYLSASELHRLVDWSRKFNAKPVFAYKKKGRWILRTLVSEDNIRTVTQEIRRNTDDESKETAGALLEELFEDRMNEL